MILTNNLTVNEQGHLAVGGADTVELAERFGTPLYVMDEAMIRKACRQFKQSIDTYYGGRGLPHYASKAFCCKEMCRIIADEGLGLDVVSMGELYTAMSVGFPAQDIGFHGNNKTKEELRYALECGVGHIIVDNLTELDTLNALAGEMGKNARIMFRVKPGIEAHTHEFIMTGQIDSKFGLALENGEAMEAVKRALSMEHVTLGGLHCHIGSQIFDIDPFVMAADVMLHFIADIKAQTGYAVEELNLGGGFGIKYTQEENPVEYDQYMRKVSDKVKADCQALGIDQPFIVIEPGRSIAGPAGLTLYRVGSVKEIPGVRTYVSIDGGMTDNPRYALYQSRYEAVCANKADAPRDQIITLAGKCCESGDLIGKDMPLQKTEPGDVVAVLATGAYNYSMASNYNRAAKPAVVMVKDGEARLIVKRETPEDLIRNDL